jgi:tetratricopeptide (TPR) repeat protein
VRAIFQRRAGFYQYSLDIRNDLVKTNPSNAQYQSYLLGSYINLGDVLMREGKLDESCKLYESSANIRKRLVEADRQNAEFQSNLSEVAHKFLIVHDFAKALDAAEEAISLAPDSANKTKMYANRAHALMFLARVDEARGLYLQYRGTKNVQGESWEGVILDDFAELRKAALTHPLMDTRLRRSSLQVADWIGLQRTSNTKNEWVSRYFNVRKAPSPTAETQGFRVLLRSDDHA